MSFFTGLAGALGGSLVGGIFGNEAADKRADAQVQATREGIQAQQRMFDQAVALQEPIREQGRRAAAVQAGLLGIPGLSPMNDPFGQQTTQMNSMARTNALNPGGGFDPYTEYVNQNRDLSNYYSQENVATAHPRLFREGYDRDGDGRISRGEYGRFHFDTFGQGEGRSLPQYQPGPNALDPTQTARTPAEEVGVPGTPQAAEDAFKDSALYRAAMPSFEDFENSGFYRSVMGGMGPPSSDGYDAFRESGYYQSMVPLTDAGMDRIVGQYASGGSLLSGGSQKALADYLKRNEAQAFRDYAGAMQTGFNNFQGANTGAFSNFYNSLGAMAGQGASASARMGNQALNFGSAQNQAALNRGNARASSYLTQGANTGQMVGNGINALASAFGQRNFNQKFGAAQNALDMAPDFSGFFGG